MLRDVDSGYFFFEDHLVQRSFGTVIWDHVDLNFGSQNHLPFGKANMAKAYPHVQW